jgi:cell wall-associated NlpC family hydrolase
MVPGVANADDIIDPNNPSERVVDVPQTSVPDLPIVPPPVVGPEMPAETPEDTVPPAITAPEVRDISQIQEDDPRYPLVLMLTDVRLEAQSAVEAAEQAEARSETAQREAENALFNSTVASVRAEHAQRLVNRWAASIYRNESGAGELVDIANTALANPALVLDIRVWFNQISSMRRQDTINAEALLQQAQKYQLEAEQAVENAEDALLEAAALREEASKTLAWAETVVEVILGQRISHQLIIGPDGCPTVAPDRTLRGGDAIDVGELCAKSVSEAPSVEAALAIKYAFRALGADYACDGIGRWQPFRYDCSSLVMRSYWQGAGVKVLLNGILPTTRNMVPWDGRVKAPWLTDILPEEAQPGDLVLYDTGRPDSRHVVMLLSDGMMIHVGACGDVVNIDRFWGWQDTERWTLLGARRVDPARVEYTWDEELPEEDWMSDSDADAAPSEAENGETVPITDERGGEPDDDRDTYPQTGDVSDLIERSRDLD